MGWDPPASAALALPVLPGRCRLPWLLAGLVLFAPCTLPDRFWGWRALKVTPAFGWGELRGPRRPWGASGAGQAMGTRGGTCGCPCPSRCLRHRITAPALQAPLSSHLSPSSPRPALDTWWPRAFIPGRILTPAGLHQRSRRQVGGQWPGEGAGELTRVLGGGRAWILCRRTHVGPAWMRPRGRGAGCGRAAGGLEPLAPQVSPWAVPSSRRPPRPPPPVTSMVWLSLGRSSPSPGH